MGVLLFHAFPNIFPGGYVGVDIFFVLSGYFIFGTFFKDGTGLLSGTVQFYKNRFLRIVPSTATLCLLVFFAGKIILFPEELADLASSIVSMLQLNTNLWAARQLNYFDQATGLKPLVHLWSLCIEIQFYLIFPLFGALLWKVRKHRHFSFYLTGLTIAAMVVAFSLRSSLGTQFYFSSIPRAWEFLAGASAYMTVKQVRLPQLKNQLIHILLLIVLLLSYVLFNENSGIPGPMTLVPVLITVFYCLSSETFFSQRILGFRGLTWVGMISFSLYLVHQPLFAFARLLAGQELSTGTGLLCILFTIVISFFYYHLCEKRWSSSKHPTFAVVGWVFASVGLMLWTTPSTQADSAKSFIESSDAQALLQYRYDNNPKGPDCRTSQLLAPEKACLYHSEHKNEVVLWGDSHADQIIPAFSEAMAQRGYSTLELSIEGCPPILNSIATKAKRQCQENTSIALDYFKSHRSVKFVFIHAYWTGYFQLGYAASTNANNLIQNLIETINVLTQKGIHVFFIGPTPQMPVDPPFYLARRKKFGLSSPTLVLSKDDFLQQTAYVKELTEQLKNNERFHPVSFDQALFDKNQGVFFANEGLVVYYRDDNHLSVTGAQKVMPELAEQIDLTGLLNSKQNMKTETR